MRLSLKNSLSMQHQSRFKTYLIASDQLANEAVELRFALRELSAMTSLKAPELVFLFITLYLQKRAPDEWWIKKKSTLITLSESQAIDSLPSSFLFLKKMNCPTVQDWLQNYEFKKMPGGVLNCLRGWLCGTHQLHLVSQPITPYEMLELQARGQRIVTLSWAAALEGGVVDGRRDAFEFLLHDLIHADLMFAESEAFKMQVQFFQSLLKVYQAGELTNELEADPQFKISFEYLISDMNSHSHHMAYLLKASYINFLLARDRQNDLTFNSQKKLNDKLNQWQLVGQFSPSLTAL